MTDQDPKPEPPPPAPRPLLGLGTPGAGTVSMKLAKRRLARLWFVAAGVLFLIVLGQTVGNAYPGKADKAWAWLLPTVVPTLSLIIGALVAEVQPTGRKEAEVDAFIVSLALALSCMYLLVVLATILVQPLVLSWTTRTEFLNLSHLWLAPLQGLVGAVLGALFVRQTKDGGTG
jgi:cytochrome bd-type quinol oxidase subunit 2